MGQKAAGQASRVDPVLHAGISMGNDPSLNAVCSHVHLVVIEAALGVLDAERGTVFLYDRSTDELFSRVATGEEEIRFPASLGIAGESAKKRELINVEDCYADARFNKEVDKKTFGSL